jgi:hypothetical protein
LDRSASPQFGSAGCNEKPAPLTEARAELVIFETFDVPAIPWGVAVSFTSQDKQPEPFGVQVWYTPHIAQPIGLKTVRLQSSAVF